MGGGGVDRNVVGKRGWRASRFGASSPTASGRLIEVKRCVGASLRRVAAASHSSVGKPALGPVAVVLFASYHLTKGSPRMRRQRFHLVMIAPRPAAALVGEPLDVCSSAPRWRHSHPSSLQVPAGDSRPRPRRQHLGLVTAALAIGTARFRPRAPTSRYRKRSHRPCSTELPAPPGCSPVVAHVRRDRQRAGRAPLALADIRRLARISERSSACPRGGSKVRKIAGAEIDPAAKASIWRESTSPCIANTPRDRGNSRSHRVSWATLLEFPTRSAALIIFASRVRMPKRPVFVDQPHARSPHMGLTMGSTAPSTAVRREDHR